MESDAARRAYCGNGMSGILPPLPTADDHDNNVSNEEEGVEEELGGGGGEEGFQTLFGHSYGALPYGNIHLSSSSSSSVGDSVRYRGLGKHLRQLNDTQLLHVLSYVDGWSDIGNRGCTGISLFVCFGTSLGIMARFGIVLRAWGGMWFHSGKEEEGRG